MDVEYAILARDLKLPETLEVPKARIVPNAQEPYQSPSPDEVCLNDFSEIVYQMIKN